jgi:hypothetical protein
VPRKRRPQERTRDAGQSGEKRERRVPTVADLAKVLQATGATWSVNPNLDPASPIPHFALGGERSAASETKEVPPIDFERRLLELPSNPFLVQRAIELGLLSRASAPRLAPERAWTEPASEPSASAPDSKGPKPEGRPRRSKRAGR